MRRKPLGPKVNYEARRREHLKGRAPIHPLSQHVSLRIRQKRRALKITQEQMAEALGTTAQYYARLEWGCRGITLKMLWRIASVMRCHYLDLIAGFVPPEQKHHKQNAPKIAVNDAVAMGADPKAAQSSKKSSVSSSQSGVSGGGSEGGSKDDSSISIERS